MSFFSRVYQSVRTYIAEVRRELQKVSWPRREDTVRYTLIVIGVSVVTAIFLGGLDFLYKYLLEAYIFR